MTSNPYFKGTSLFDAEYLRNDTRYTHGYYRPLIRSDMWPNNCTIANDLEWSLKVISGNISGFITILRISNIPHIITYDVNYNGCDVWAIDAERDLLAILFLVLYCCCCQCRLVAAGWSVVGRRCWLPGPTQPFIHSGTVNKYQLSVERQRQLRPA